MGAGVAEVAVAFGQHWRWWQWRLAATVFQGQSAAVIIHACHSGAGDTALQNCDEVQQLRGVLLTMGRTEEVSA